MTKFKNFDDSQALTTKAAAKFLDYSCASLHKWRVEGRGPRFIKISRTSIRYMLKDLKLWLEEHAMKQKIVRKWEND